MKTSLLAFCLSVLTLNGSAKDVDSPWQTLSVRGPAVVASLPKDRRWLVTFNQQEPRMSAFGESFSLRAGDTLTLAERHSSYTFTPRFAPQPAGLECVFVFHAESFGGGAERRTSFLPAR